jgi:NADH-quinone oxidoreductase subunit B
LEVRREPLGASDGHVEPEHLRVRTLNSQQLLRDHQIEGLHRPAHLEGAELESYVEERVLTTTLDRAVAWARSNSFFPATFGLACCAIEMMSIVASRVDVARFGFEAFRASPRQADLLILSGRVSIKMAPVVRRIYDQMLEPKWAIAMGACCSSMGVFNNYAIVPADKFMPVDVYVPGCPPRPEALMHGVLKLRKMVQDDPDKGWRERYGARGTEEVLPEPGAGEEREAAVSAPPAGGRVA